MDKRWSESEQFTLDTKLGAFHDVVNFAIQPLFTWKQQEGNWELKGVYKLMVTSQVVEHTSETDVNHDFVVIDDVDEVDAGAYFEYALPFQVVLDGDKVEPGTTPEFHITSKHATLDDAVVQCHWEACVSFQEVSVKTESTSSYYEPEDAMEEWHDSTIEFTDLVVVDADPNLLAKWKDSYVTLRIPVKSHHDGT